MFFQHSHLVPAVFVEPDFTDTQDVRAFHELGNDGEHLLRKADVLRFLRVNAKPRVMRKAEHRGTTRFVLGQLTKIIVKALCGAAIEAGPECRFAYRLAPSHDHRLIIIRRPADHVAVRFDISHRGNQSLFTSPGQAPQAALVVATGIGSSVGSLNAKRTFSARFG